MPHTLRVKSPWYEDRSLKLTFENAEDALNTLYIIMRISDQLLPDTLTMRAEVVKDND